MVSQPELLPSVLAFTQNSIARVKADSVLQRSIAAWPHPRPM